MAATWLAAQVLPLLAAGPAAAATIHVPFYDVIVPAESVRPAAADGGAQRVTLRLTSGARPVELLLEPNTTLQPAGPRRGGASAWRGTVAGLSGSWVRVTRHRGSWTGVFHDGAALYGIDTAGGLRAANAGAAALPPGAQVVYRFADVRVTGPLFDGDTGRPRSGSEAAEALMDLPPPRLAAVLATRRLGVGLVTDPQLAAIDAGETESRALARLNVADGVFATQVGVQLRQAAYTALPADSPLTAPTSSALLDQLAEYRAGSSVEATTGLTYLITGRDLEENRVGIAFLGGLCNRRFAAALSETRNSINFDGLVMAHEIGHVFGAPHDGETGSACSATTGSFIMSTQYNGSQEFSACSLEQMQPRLTASCLAAVDAADAALGLPASAPLALDQASPASFTVRSVGTAIVRDVVVTTTLPTSITPAAAGVTGGSCAITGQQVRCTLGELAPDATRTVQLSLTSRVAGSASAAVALTAANDGLATNNAATLRFATAPGADLVATVTAPVATLQTGAGTSVTVGLRNAGLASAGDARVTVTLPAGLVAASVTPTGLSCTLASGAIDCPAFRLDAGATAQLVVAVTARTAGTQRIAAALRSSLTDPQPANNEAALDLAVSDPPPPPPAGGGSGGSAGSGGGGGQAGAALLAGLAALAWARLARRTGRQRQPAAK